MLTGSGTLKFGDIYDGVIYNGVSTVPTEGVIGVLLLNLNELVFDLGV